MLDFAYVIAQDSLLPVWQLNRVLTLNYNAILYIFMVRSFQTSAVRNKGIYYVVAMDGWIRRGTQCHRVPLAHPTTAEFQWGL